MTTKLPALAPAPSRRGSAWDARSDESGGGLGVAKALVATARRLTSPSG